MEDKKSYLPVIQDRETPTSTISGSTHDETIQISEEKLIKLRKSAKKLESSLQDALHQIDSFRKNTSKPSGGMNSLSKQRNTTNHSMKLKPLLAIESPDTKTKRSDLGFPDIQPLEMIVSPRAHREQHYVRIIKAKTPEKQTQPQNLPMMDTSDLINRQTRHNNSPVNSPIKLDRTSMRTEKVTIHGSSRQPTFRTLVRSLDEMRVRKSHKLKGAKKISKCLRCAKLFASTDNHKKACCYHSRNKQRVEEYTHKGRLTKVSYVWQCCQQGLDSLGCCYGKHL